MMIMQRDVMAPPAYAVAGAASGAAYNARASSAAHDGVAAQRCRHKSRSES
jgi:hypothetical protein